MSEILRSEEVQAGYEEGIFDARSEKESGKIVQLKQEELSPVDYKTQALLSIFLWPFSASHFYAGNYGKGVLLFAGMVLSVFPGLMCISAIGSVVIPYEVARVVIKVILGIVVASCFSVFLLIQPPVAFYSLIQLNEGNSTDSDGKVIRQVVQLKKEEISSTDQKTTLILSVFLGWIGVHQFYTGKPFKGVLMLCSLGGLGIWNLMNIYQIATCNFRDGQDKVLCPAYIKASHGM